MSFLDELRNATNTTITENGDTAYNSSLDPVLDYFGLVGAMRDRAADTADLFEKAYIADPQMAVRALFYMRDIRGGQGERDVFLAGLHRLRRINPSVYVSMLPFVPEYGRWADLFVDEIGHDLLFFIEKQLIVDKRAMAVGEPVSLLAKWLPSENASSAESRKKARQIAKGLGLTPKEYRKRVVALRKYIDLLEHKMSANEWSEIDYSKVPSQAFRKHTKAFARQDEMRFSAFLEQASKGEVNLNTSTLYAYEVFDALKRGEEAAANAMWANLPDYTKGTDSLVLADVSDSMNRGNGRPMAVSVSLALYFAERNTGTFKSHFMTFSEEPQLVRVVGNSLSQRMRCIETSKWGYNTNLIKALLLILYVAESSNSKQEDLPSVLYIISDMQFDEAFSDHGYYRTNRREAPTTLQVAQDAFEEAGYTMPHVVFWNVFAPTNQLPATIMDNKVTLLSGSSQSTFRYAVEGKTPQEFMIDVLTSDRYAQIVV